MKEYGIPYQGSKRRLAEDIVNLLPSAPVLVDLFAGGCAVTHAALKSGKFKKVIANDINGEMPELFSAVIKGWKVPLRWISREEFDRRKNGKSLEDTAISICWSFGNTRRGYLFGKYIEDYKLGLWKARAEGDFSWFEKHGIDLGGDASRQGILKHEKELMAIKELSSVKSMQNLMSMQSLERIRNIESIGCLKNADALETSCLDYREVQIPEGAVVYCDPPYVGTPQYSEDGKKRKTFNTDEFWEWCRKQTAPVFVSELNAPPDFVPMISKTHCYSFSAFDNTRHVSECVFVHKSKMKDFIEPTYDKFFH